MRPTTTLLRLYPARWRARYGDEFAALLEERPLGPFDVADILLGALDAHRHLRGLGAASQHAKGFAMSLRIGGYAAIFGGILWFVALVGNAINNGADSGSSLFGIVLLTSIVAAVAATLVALVGLSAFQSRRHPVLTWTAFAIPAIGAFVALLGVVAMVVAGDSDSTFLGGPSAWAISTIGVTALVVGSALFAIATWLSGSLSRAASALLLVGALLVMPAIGGMTGGLVPPALGYLALVTAILAFPVGWIALGVSALRITVPRPVHLEGASL
ncbi:MAG TPA: hypothetical protein VER83_04025 [Candidatus Nanopelagicales bacterium]|nr:hypothetical protein [Candidatus Nanopelagicales bacterium]